MKHNRKKKKLLHKQKNIFIYFYVEKYKYAVLNYIFKIKNK